MKKFDLIGVALIATMSLFSLTSCSKDGTGDNDGDGYDRYGLSTVTIEELEAQPSFYYENQSTKTTYYVWFRNGVMTFFLDSPKSSEGYVMSYKYKIDGYNLTIWNSSNTYTGYISKTERKNQKILAISQGIDGTNLGNLPKDLMHEYRYGTFRFDK